MSISIEVVTNGFILSFLDCESELEKQVYSYDEDEVFGNPTQADAGVCLLYSIVDILGLRGSRYDRERIFISKVMGDKYTPTENEEVCEGTYEIVLPKFQGGRDKDCPQDGDKSAQNSPPKGGRL